MILKKISISLANQILGAGTGFFFSVYLLRAINVAEFGLYGIGFSVCLIFCGVGNALLITQMTVNASDYNCADRKNYIKSIHALVYIYAILILLASIATAFGMALLYIPKKWIAYSIGLGILSSGYILKEFYVRLSFLEKKEKVALSSNAICFISIIALSSIAYLNNYVWTASTALLAFGASQYSAALTGLLRSGLKLEKFSMEEFKKAIAPSLTHSAWSTAGVFIAWLQSQSYLYICGLSLGAHELGRANATKVLISPFTFILPAINQLALPRLAELRVSNKTLALNFSLRIASFLTISTILYSVFILLAGMDIFSIYSKGKYGAIVDLALAWCIYLIAQTARDAASTSILSRKGYKLITIINTASIFITLPLSFALSVSWGAAGAVFALAIGEIILGAMLWIYIYKTQRSLL